MSVLQRVFRYFQLRDADRQGDGRLVQMFGGADKADFTRGDIAVFDASGSVIDGGPPASNSGGYGSPWQQVPVGIMNMANADFYLDFIPLTFTNLAGVEEVWMQLDVNGDGQDPYFHFHAFPGTNHFVMRFPPKASDVEMVCRYFRGIPAFTPPPPGVTPPPAPPPPPPPLPPSPCGSITITQLADCGLPHAYWRLFITETNSGGTGTAVGLAEIELRTTFGGMDVANGGSAFASASTFTTPGDAFDDNPATVWGNAGSGPPGDFIGYQLPTPLAIAEVAVTARNDGDYTFQTPCAFTVDWSDDGSTWTSIVAITIPVFATGDPCGWSAGEKKVFSICANAAPPPPPAPTATLDIWADYPEVAHGFPGVSYTLDNGLTWVGGDGTLPTDIGVQI